MRIISILLLLLSTLFAFPTAVMAEQEKADAATENVSTNAPLVSSEIDTQQCPQQFYAVTLPTNGKLCQVFATELPASMIFFVPQAPSEVVDFYRQRSGVFTTTKQVRQRYMLKSDDNTTTLIISKDGQGSQVDVLVVESKET